MSKVLHTTVLLDGTPADVVLVEPRPGYLTLQIDTALTLMLDMAPVETLRAIAAAFDAAADLKDQAAIVALNTPALPAPATGTLCVPDWGTGQGQVAS